MKILKIRPPNNSELSIPYEAYRYAVHILNGKFAAGEYAMWTDPAIWEVYQDFLVNKRLAEIQWNMANCAGYLK